MSGREIFMLVFTLLGGLALFIFGMNIMTTGLRKAVGAKLQRLLSKATKNRFSGLGLGTTLGTLVHSSATTVMLVGFVNAGLMTLNQTIAPMLGANIGTTLSMQAISFKLSDYCFVAIATGLILSLVSRNTKVKELGRALLGFGLLFLGMDLMSDSIKPHRELLSQYLQGINGDSYLGLILGVLVSMTLTAIWQSSGATIAIIFAMVSAGVFTQFTQVYPIVLGAHIGTCATALLGSIGTNIEARRSAISHLVFNIFNVLIAILAKPFFLYLVPLTSDDLIRQTANLHTIVIATGALIILPFTSQYTRFLRVIVPSKKPMPESSYINYDLLEYPERAITAVISELQRVMKICSSSLYTTANIILHKYDRSTVLKIKTNEKVVDEIKVATREYLWKMTQRYLSRRQIIMAHHLNSCMSDIERIGDHIDQLSDLSTSRPKSIMDKGSFDGLFELYEKVCKILSSEIESMDTEKADFKEKSLSILEDISDYHNASSNIQKLFLEKVARHEVTSIALLHLHEYVAVLDRIVRHMENIASYMTHEDFWIKESKLDKKPKDLDTPTIDMDVDPDEYLKKLKS